nr:hypothetical protein [Tanacetum cinerariifolium]
ERFETTDPKNFLDDFLLHILKIMFEKVDIEANVWKDNKVEKKYPLIHFTLQQMLDNVRLEVEKESEMSLELLSLKLETMVEDLHIRMIQKLWLPLMERILTSLDMLRKESDLEDTPVNDRYAVRIHEIPPSMTGNYMHSGPDVEIDYSKLTYGPKQTSVDESDSKPSEYASCESDSSTDAPIIEEYELDSDNDSVSNVEEDKQKPSFAFTDAVKHVKLFSFSHLITDCDFHEKRIAKQAALIKTKNKVIGQRENRSEWNTVQRVNHQNEFVPSVL